MRQHAPAAASGLQALRASTRDDHRRLDRTPLVRGLLDVEHAAAGYRRFMRQLHRCYLAIEPGLVQFERTCADSPRYRARLPAIRSELRQLGEAQAMDTEMALAVPESAAEYWGRRYVLDGSCHGARQLKPALSRRPSLRTATDFAYWDVLLALAPQWPAVVDRIEVHGRDIAAQMAMIAGARTVFACFVRGFTEEGR